MWSFLQRSILIPFPQLLVYLFDKFLYDKIIWTSFFYRWKPFDPSRNWPDLGPRFAKGEQKARATLKADAATTDADNESEYEDKVSDDKRDLDWATVLKRTFESYIRGERPNMYGEWMQWWTFFLCIHIFCSAMRMWIKVTLREGDGHISNYRIFASRVDFFSSDFGLF